MDINLDIIWIRRKKEKKKKGTRGSGPQVWFIVIVDRVHDFIDVVLMWQSLTGTMEILDLVHVFPLIIVNPVHDFNTYFLN